jgi:hypothetical protein
MVLPCLLAWPAQSSAVDFRRDVVPALTKAGCNAGACHGAFQGRGGFALSLLGFDPVADFATIVQADRGRRVLPAAPDYSLILRKASGLAAHAGGKRLDPRGTGYSLLREWMAAGMPPPRETDPVAVALEVTPRDLVLAVGQSAPLRVVARWSDGLVRDVTPWALFDSRDAMANSVSTQGVITAHRPGLSPVSVRYFGLVAAVNVTTPFGPALPLTDFPRHNFIDELVASEWQRLGVKPAPLADDATFIRRASLDLTGTLPTPEQVLAFVNSQSADKRAKLIDDLLERPEYVDYWSLKWGDLLRVHRRYVGNKGLGSFGGWLRRSVRENKPLDVMVRELLTAQGNLFVNGPVAYYLVDQKPDELAETTAQLFLGVRMQCARCHHHPFEVWAQADYWGLAAFFTRLEMRQNGDQGRFGGLQTLRVVDKETRPLQILAQPRVLGAAAPASPVAAGGDVRVALAEWITRADNPYFARNFANRYWAYLMGRGLVEAIDDQRATNPPSNPQLLDALARELSEHKFDVKHLLRTICRSSVYQLAVEISAERDREGDLFTHRVARRLPAEVLLDAVNQATGYLEPFEGTPAGTRAIALPDPTVVSSFLTTFGRPQRINPCECARESSPDLLQALHLLNNPALQTRIAHADGRIARLVKAARPDNEIATELYLATVSRRPNEHELAQVRELLREAPSPREGWEDILWALLNSPEFAFNH